MDSDKDLTVHDMPISSSHKSSFPTDSRMEEPAVTKHKAELPEGCDHHVLIEKSMSKNAVV